MKEQTQGEEEAEQHRAPQQLHRQLHWIRRMIMIMPTLPTIISQSTGDTVLRYGGGQSSQPRLEGRTGWGEASAHVVDADFDAPMQI